MAVGLKKSVQSLENILKIWNVYLCVVWEYQYDPYTACQTAQAEWEEEKHLFCRQHRSCCHPQSFVSSVRFKINRLWAHSGMSWCAFQLWDESPDVSLWWELTHVQSTVCQHTDTVTDSELMTRRHGGKRGELPPTPLRLHHVCLCVCFLLCSPRSTLHGHTGPPPSTCNCWHCSSHWCTPANRHTPRLRQHKPSTHQDEIPLSFKSHDYCTGVTIKGLSKMCFCLKKESQRSEGELERALPRERKMAWPTWRHTS